MGRVLLFGPTEALQKRLSEGRLGIVPSDSLIMSLEYQATSEHCYTALRGLAYWYLHV
jgi:hypothetical protein